MDIIGVHYNEIKSLFKTRSYNTGVSFDEDSFNDAFIKCAQKFGNNEVTLELTIKYFWTAYLNTVKSNIAKDNKLETVSLDTEMHDCAEEDNDYTINIYNIVMDAISTKFGEEQMMMYSLYKLHDWSKQDLEDSGYDMEDFEIRIKEIHKFVKTYCKKHINGK